MRNESVRGELAALLALLALPVTAFAQTPGDPGFIIANSSTINIAQCSGTASNPDVGLQDSLTVNLSWTVKLDAGSSFTPGGFYRIYVADAQSAAGQGTVISCTLPANTGSTYNPQQLGTDIVAGSATTAARAYSLAQIVTLAGFNCTDPAPVTVYLCVQWLSGGTAHGYATGSLSLDRTSPAAPTGLRATGGDGALYLDCAAGDADTAGYKARATSLADSSTHFSSRASRCGDLTIGGLVNGETYSVVVFGLDAAGNPSVASAAVEAQPLQTDDFWTHYKNEGGQDAGGCSGAGAPGLLGLLGALALLGLRRRGR